MKLALLFSAFLLVPIGTLAQEHPAVTAQSNTVYVGADGKFEAAPDTAQIQMNVSVQDDSPQTAYQRAQKDVDQVRQVLRANGLDTKLAVIGFFSVQPKYEFRPRQRVIGYTVMTDISLKLKEFSKIGQITQQLADANVSETQTLNYILENMDEAKNRAVEDAYRRARNSAETVARASGRSLGELSYASVDTFENPRIVMHPQMRAMGAMAKAEPAPTDEFTPQTVTVTAHVNALFNLK